MAEIIPVKCVNLDHLYAQLQEEGSIKVDANDPPSEAKLAILRSLGPVEFIEGGELFVPSSDIPTTSDPYHQMFIEEAHREAARTTCWMHGAGSVVVDDGNLVARGHNHPVLPGKFCEGLPVTFNEVKNLLKPGERLDFCQTLHDVASVITDAARFGRRIGGMTWYLNMEPCDNCANALIAVEPKAVYFSLGVGRARYYNSVGLERLIAARVPTFFVEMPKDE